MAFPYLEAAGAKLGEAWEFFPGGFTGAGLGKGIHGTGIGEPVSAPATSEGVRSKINKVGQFGMGFGGNETETIVPEGEEVTLFTFWIYMHGSPAAGTGAEIEGEYSPSGGEKVLGAKVKITGNANKWWSCTVKPKGNIPKGGGAPVQNSQLILYVNQVKSETAKLSEVFAAYAVATTTTFSVATKKLIIADQAMMRAATR